MKLSYVYFVVLFFSIISSAMEEPPLTPRSAKIAQLELQNSEQAKEMAQLRSALDLLIAERNQERKLKELEDARFAQQALAMQLKQNNWSIILNKYSKVVGIKLLAAAQTAGTAFYLKNAIKQLVSVLPIPSVYQSLAQQVLPETAGVVAQGGTFLTHRGIEFLLKSPHLRFALQKTKDELVVFETNTLYLLEETSKLAQSAAYGVWLPFRTFYFACNCAYHLITTDPDPHAREAYAARRNQERIEDGWVLISKGE